MEYLLRSTASLTLLLWLGLVAAPATAAPKAATTKLRGHRGYISALAFSPDGRYIASSSSTVQDRSTRLWEVASKRQIASYPSNHSPLFSPDSKFLATSFTAGPKGSPQVHVAVRRLGSNTPLWKAEGGNPVFSPDGKWVGVDDVNASGIEVVKLIDTATGTPGPTVEGRRGSFSIDGKLLATSSRIGDDWVTQVWDPSTGMVAKGFYEVPYIDGDQALFCPPLRIATRIDRRPTAPRCQIYALESGRSASATSLAGHPVAFHEGQDWLLAEDPVTDDADAAVNVYRLHDGTLAGSCGGRFLALSPGGRWLATEGRFDKKYPGVRLWDLWTMNETTTLFGGSDEVTAAAFSPDNSLLAVASAGSREILLQDLSKL